MIDLITVCSNCLRASCWLGYFYCDEYKTAGIIEKSISELKELQLESPDYWKEGVQPSILATIRNLDKQ